MEETITLMAEILEPAHWKEHLDYVLSKTTLNYFDFLLLNMMKVAKAKDLKIAGLIRKKLQ
jgi:hypothetical protein